MCSQSKGIGSADISASTYDKIRTIPARLHCASHRRDNARPQARERAGAKHERRLFPVACRPLLGVGSGTGHRLAAPNVYHPFQPPMDRWVWEYLSFASLARSLL